MPNSEKPKFYLGSCNLAYEEHHTHEVRPKVEVVIYAFAEPVIMPPDKIISLLCDHGEHMPVERIKIEDDGNPQPQTPDVKKRISGRLCMAGIPQEIAEKMACQISPGDKFSYVSMLNNGQIIAGLVTRNRENNIIDKAFLMTFPAMMEEKSE